MKCEDVTADVDSLLQNPGDQGVSQRLEKHLRECEKCRQELGDIINTAAKLSEVGQISDFVDVSDEFIERTREEAQKESDRFRMSAIRPGRKKQKAADLVIILLLAGTVIAAIIIFYLAVTYL